MGWRFHWVSAFGTEFPRDYGVHFMKEELADDVDYNYGKTRFGVEEAPGLSVFHKDEAGEIFHTYSTNARGLESLVGTYHFLDLVPKGATKRAWRSPCRGSAITTGTATITWSIPRQLMRSHAKRGHAAKTRSRSDDRAVLHGRGAIAPPRPASGLNTTLRGQLPWCLGPY
jgi:hypothetical protein